MRQATLLNNKLESFEVQGIKLPTIQALLAIVTFLVYDLNNHYDFSQINPAIALIVCLLVSPVVANFYSDKKFKLKPWHFLIFLSVLALVFNYDASVNAQVLQGVDGAVDTVGTAAGGSFAAAALDAVIEIFRIAVFAVIVGAVIASIIYGVAQSQWQAPVLVCGVVAAGTLFMEVMDNVIFG